MKHKYRIMHLTQQEQLNKTIGIIYIEIILFNKTTVLLEKKCLLPFIAK